MDIDLLNKRQDKNSMQQKGRITSWNDDKGFGFITPIGSSKEVFIHIKSFSNRSSRPKINQIVIYDLSKDKQGRLCAENALRPSDNSRKGTKDKKSTLSVIPVGIFTIVLLFLVLSGRVHIIVPALYFFISVITFIMYAIDKSAATNDSWRTPESTLHVLSLLGGWPGAMIAQKILRHKSSKQSFRSAFFATLMINLAGLAYLVVSKNTIFSHSPF